jgi:hypothetical protein
VNNASKGPPVGPVSTSPLLSADLLCEVVKVATFECVDTIAALLDGVQDAAPENKRRSEQARDREWTSFLVPRLLSPLSGVRLCSDLGPPEVKTPICWLGCLAAMFENNAGKSGRPHPIELRRPEKREQSLILSKCISNAYWTEKADKEGRERDNAER